MACFSQLAGVVGNPYKACLMTLEQGGFRRFSSLFRKIWRPGFRIVMTNGGGSGANGFPKRYPPKTNIFAPETLGLVQMS